MKKDMINDSDRMLSSAAIVRESLPDRIKEDLVDHDYAFEVFDIEKEQGSRAYAVFSVNTLEHTEDPIQTLKTIVRACEQYAIVLLPFENGSSSQINRFDISSFPENIDDQYEISFFKILDPTYQNDASLMGRQILLVYQKKSDSSRLSMREIYEKQIKELMQENSLQREAFEIIRENSAGYGERVKQLVLHERLLNEKIAAVSDSTPFKIAHASVEAKHILRGSKEERKRGMEWLLKDKSVNTSYNYMREISELDQYIGTVLDDINGDIESDKEKSIIVDFLMEHSRADFIVLIPSLIDWNVPLFQRPQQMAMALGRIGIPVVYFTWNTYDKIDMPVRIYENCLLVKANHVDVVRQKLKWISDFLDSSRINTVIDVYSTGYMYDLGFFDGFGPYQDKVLYEYIDELSDEISALKLPEQFMEMHKAFLKDERIKVIATADKLHNDVVCLRNSTKNVLCSGNGVDTAHFQNEADPKGVSRSLQRIINEGKPIIGYFGALAMWFDYELVKEAARRRPDYNFLLIGPEYEGSDSALINSLKTFDNITMPGVIDYDVLPAVARHFTVATIPFLLNDITESTSPIKLFEYMSMGKPVVTTAMRECLKIPEVMIAHDADEYVKYLDQAVSIMSGPERPNYEKKMMDVAEAHSWNVKAKEFVELVKS